MKMVFLIILSQYVSRDDTFGPAFSQVSANILPVIQFFLYEQQPTVP